jgi:PAS domain S-box-containing protein
VGDARHVVLTGVGGGGRAAAATVLLQDVTDRIRAERASAEAERRFRTLVQGVDAIVWETDPASGQFGFVSQRAEEILGYPVARWLGEPDFWERHLHPDDRERVVAARRTGAGEGRDHALEYRMLAEDGGERWIRDRATVLCDETGRPRRLLGLMVDVTERRRTEESLARLLAQAEEEVQRKDEFLAILGHELRTPLGAITSALHLLRQKIADDPIVGQAVAIVGRQSRHLTRLMDELLDVARIGSGKMVLDLREVDLNEVVAHSLEALRERLGERAGAVVFAATPAPLVVRGDAVRLAQVVTNLLDNAVKYSPAQSRVEIHLARAGASAVIRVRDAGVGLSAEMLVRIFEPFYQRSVERSRGGLGLGLTLVRRLVELHGGRVSASSEGPGRGSEFVVRVPVSGPAPSRAEPEPPAAAFPAARRILVIEDDADAREMLRVLLETHGYAVEVAEDGPRGIEASRAAGHDAILVDLGLPGLEGFEVVPRLGVHGGRRPYVVAITGSSQPGDRRRAADAGFDAYVVKPVEPDHLLRLLGEAFDSSPGDADA